MFSALIDDEDFERVNKYFWSVKHDSYTNQGRSKTSQYKGVSFDKRIMKWGTQISINGKIKNLGYYENEKDAAIVYNQNARQLFGEFANLNQL